MEILSVAQQPGAVGCHDHLVEFYDTDHFLAETVATFLLPALRSGDSAVVVATVSHRRMFDTALRKAGIDIDAAAREGRYLAFDAGPLLSFFMENGAPDAALFQETIGSVMDVASQDGRQVSVYGEMVALLWDAGDVASALALEDLWNDLADVRAFGLLCAYPATAFDETTTAAFERVCEQHSAVIPSESGLGRRPAVRAVPAVSV